MNALLETLRKFDAIRTGEDGQGDEIATRTLPNREPEFAPPSALARLPSFLQAGLASVGITRLYAHQAQAFDLASKGLDLVLESPTASGKTLCFNVPLILKLLSDPKAHALMIHPMKALSNDQRRQFEQLSAKLCGPSTRQIKSWLYDGDTEDEHKGLLKANPPAVLMTNPEMLHGSFLGWSEQWDRRFLKNLKVIVIDEMHEYRGFFGTNFSLLFRRFLTSSTGSVHILSSFSPRPRAPTPKSTPSDLLVARTSHSSRPATECDRCDTLPSSTRRFQTSGSWTSIAFGSPWQLSPVCTTD